MVVISADNYTYLHSIGSKNQTKIRYFIDIGLQNPIKFIIFARII